MSYTKKFYLIFVVLFIFILGITLKEGICQYYGWSYPPFLPYVQNPFPHPYYNYLAPNPLPLPQLFPIPMTPIPYTRSPHATIILATGLTAVSPAGGVIVIGTPTAVNTTAAVVTPTPTVPAAPPAPAPLFSLLAIIYASALYAPALLSTANPLLFAYLSTLVL